MRPWAMTPKPLAGVRVVFKVESIGRSAIGQSPWGEDIQAELT